MTLPADFIELMTQQLGSDVATRLFEGLGQEPCVSVRLNRDKVFAASSFSVPPIDSEPVEWCPDGYYLHQRPAFTFDPLFHAGVYYVQEASSMYLSQMLTSFLPEGDLLVLDLCAAPGGKSTLLRNALTPGSLLVSNEPMRPRAQVLAENMVKWGHPACVVTNNFPADFSHLQETFDVIVVDAPCSGEGMFRKDETAVREWSLDNVAMCAQRQREILADIWPCLRPGGLLIYSTCTFNRQEDEENVAWLVSRFGAEELDQRHFFPGIDRGEGLYMAALRKNGKFEATEQQVSKNSIFRGLLGSFEAIKQADKQLAVPAKHAVFVKKLLRTMKVLVAGVQVQELRGRDWVPSHALAMCQNFERGTYPEVALDYTQAVAYLRREVLRVDAPRGYVLLTYRDVPLGFAKSVGGRLNNMYPQEWRIRTTYQPASLPSVLD